MYNMVSHLIHAMGKMMWMYHHGGGLTKEETIADFDWTKDSLEAERDIIEGNM